MFSRDNEPFAVACLALVLSFLVIVALHPSSFFTNLAGWVQAIGSIGAILAAYHMGALQAKRAERNEILRDQQATRSAYYLLQFARDAAAFARGTFKPGIGWGSRLDEVFVRIESARYAIESYDLSSVPNARVVKAMATVATLLAVIETLKPRAEAMAPRVIYKLEDLHNQILDECSSALNVVDRIGS